MMTRDEFLSLPIGSHLFTGTSIYRITRRTAVRAYVNRVTELHLPHALSGYGMVGGGSKAGLYIEWPDYRREREGIVALPNLHDDEEARAHILCAKRDQAPIRDRINKLSREIEEAKTAERDAILGALTGTFSEAS